MTGAAPRAVGVRKAYAEVPDRVRAWVDDVLGSPVRETFEQVGGMSPGCATRVVAADGTRAFVKAVGPELNPMTPGLFRHETAVLSHLGRHDLWAGLLASYDEPDGWVALVLEDVPGRHVDTTDPDDEARLLAATDDLVAELAGAGAGLDIASTRQCIARWGEAWPEVATLPRGVLPDWVHEHAGALVERHERLLAVAEGDAVVQGDIRNDKVLVREDGDVVFVDWGMSRVGPAWFDPLAVRLVGGGPAVRRPGPLLPGAGRARRRPRHRAAHLARRVAGLPDDRGGRRGPADPQRLPAPGVVPAARGCAP